MHLRLHEQRLEKLYVTYSILQYGQTIFCYLTEYENESNTKR